uniref:Protein kinase domain-containing protein n=1 Tax=Biomphalaria glabrata TaxID=6526 RepID=A0A2C9JXV3_BIOGL
MENLLDNALKKTKISQWMEERKQQKKNFAELQLKKEDFITDRLNKMDVLNRLKNAVTSVIPGNPLARDFDIHGQVASTGPGLLWKIFSAVKKSTKEEAAVFYFEKKVLDKYHKRDKEVIIESLRKGVQQLTKLRHPRILSVIHPLEETREALAFATEPVFSSLANVLGSCDNLSGGSKILTEFQLYEVEIKHGLLQAFFTCHEWRSDMPRDAQPNLDYMAPEYELNHTCSPASDMFSFGILMYALHNNGRPLYECEGELRTFRQNAEELGSMRNSLLSKMPSQLADHVKLLLNLEPTIRPDAAQMMKIPFFEDMACIALQYIDSLYQRENIEKSNFFKGLPKIIECLPKRVSQQRVLPALFKEGVNANMVPFILPSIFLISEQSTTEEYREMVLPELIPFFKIREPIQVMLMFLQNMNLLLSKTPAQQIQTYVFPLIFAALEADSPQIQELCLSIIPTFADLIEYTTLKKSMIPRIKKLCLGTSVLNGEEELRYWCHFSKLLGRRRATLLVSFLKVAREKKSYATGVISLMSILGIHKVALSEPKLGITKDVMANKVLPFLIPLCIDNNLNLNQFNAYMGVVKEMLSKVETEHRTKLEQLDQIQQEHKTLEISKIVGENGSFGKQEGKTFMDKFWSGIGFGGGGGGESMKVNASSTPEVNSGVNVTPKKTTLSLEEKQKLAKQQEQEKALKSQPPLALQSKTPSTSKPSSVTPSSGPRDLTSTLMESNMRNLSMSSKSSSGSNIGSPAGTPMSTSGGANWPGATGMGGGVNWASASSTNSQYMTPQSSNTSFPSAEKPKVDLSSFDTLLTTPSSAKKVPVNQMGQSTGMWTASQPGMTPRPSLGMTGAGGMSNSQGWGQNTMPSYQQPTFGAFTASPSTNQSWGGGGIRPMSGVMQSMQASQQNSAASKSLTSDDLKDLLG